MTISVSADLGIEELQKCVDTLIVIPNQNLFRLANDKTTFADAFAMADQVLYSGVACITDLMVKEGLINLDFADVRSVMREMGKAMMGTGEASGEGRAMAAAEAAIANPLLDETSMKGAKGLLISITGGRDLTLFEVDEAATRIREEVDQDANIILGATFDEDLEGVIRVSVVATGIDKSAADIASAPIAIRPPLKTAPRPAAEIHHAAPAAPAQPVQEARPEPRAADPVADAIRMAEAHAATAAAPVAPRPAPAEDFRPQSRLFQSPPPAQPQPAFQQPQIHAQPQMVHSPAPQREAIPQPVAAAQPRMPRVEDFPPLVKAEVEAKSRPAEHHDSGPMSLLKRLTNGLTRREEEPARLQPAQPREPKLRQVAPEVRRAAATSQDAQLYAPRRGQLDEHGRIAPQARPQEDDQLEIPAFLRRQAN
jgi:cell division protein FtsZ